MIEQGDLPASTSSSLIVKLADNVDEIAEAYRLRYRVFVEEHKASHLMNEARMEIDDYDAYCDHLIVKDLTHNRVVGNYRLLPGSRVPQLGLYTQTEFELNGFRSEIPRALELGRTCIDPDYRNSRTMMLLWEGMLRYFAKPEFDYLVGCASMQIKDPHDLNVIYSYLCGKTFAIDRFGIQPLEHLKVSNVRRLDDVDEKTAYQKLSPMIKGYLRLGSEIVREPIYDPIFDTYDFCMVLEKNGLSPKYKRHFLSDES